MFGIEINNMKVKKEIKEALLNLIKGAQVTGIPDTPEFNKAVEVYRETRQFIESLEIQ